LISIDIYLTSQQTDSYVQAYNALIEPFEDQQTALPTVANVTVMLARFY